MAAYACLTVLRARELDAGKAVRGVQAEVAGHGADLRGHRDARAGRRQVTLVKIVGHRATSRFVRTSRARTRAVAQEGSVRTLPRMRQFSRWAKPCSTGARTAASLAKALYLGENRSWKELGPDTMRS